MFQDAYRYTTRGGWRILVMLLYHPGFQACVAYRIAHRLQRWHLGPLALLVWRITYTLTGTDIRPKAVIGRGLCLPHPHGVVIGLNVRVGSDCTLYDGVNLGVRRWTPGLNAESAEWPTIGNGVVVGTGAKVLGPVEVGDGATIGANAVVLSSVPAGAVAVGVPARVLSSKKGSGECASSV